MGGGGVILDPPPQKKIPTRKITQFGHTMPGPRSFNWVFTLNNYTDEDIKSIQGWTKNGVIGVGYGKEVGKEGTPPLQGYVHMGKQSNQKRMKELSPKAHWEVMKGKLSQSEAYCSKEGELTIIGK
jgi:hypothetical protein